MITADIILHNIDAGSKKQAFQHMVEAVAGHIGADADALMTALIDRERIGSTGIGNGVAIPHIKVAGLEKPFGVLARLEKPVDYDAIDGLPVDIVFMLLAPQESRTTQHLKLLAQVSRLLKDGKTCNGIRSAETRDSITRLLDEWARAQAA